MEIASRMLKAYFHYTYPLDSCLLQNDLKLSMLAKLATEMVWLPTRKLFTVPAHGTYGMDVGLESCHPNEHILPSAERISFRTRVKEKLIQKRKHLEDEVNIKYQCLNAWKKN